MDFKANTFLSEISCTDYSDGLSLNFRALRCWLHQKGITMGKLAKMLKMPRRKLRWKLYKRKKFSKKEITSLVYILGAWSAIRVLWFPSLQEKRRIRDELEERQMSNKFDPEKPYGGVLLSESRSRRIEDEYREMYDGWEESGAIVELALYSDELPSKKLLRRKDND